ncbi:MAG: translation elongation factor-like protein [Elusimicrobia bacterium]|nr:translation elongation factor-like protein [Elusimicrobiota bacterium]
MKKVNQPPKAEVVEGILLGKVEDYFAHIGVIALKLKGALAVGDTIRVKGHTTDLVMKVESIQIEHQTVTLARTGDGVGIKIADRARKGDRVYRI